MRPFIQSEQMLVSLLTHVLCVNKFKLEPYPSDDNMMSKVYLLWYGRSGPHKPDHWGQPCSRAPSGVDSLGHTQEKTEKKQIFFKNLNACHLELTSDAGDGIIQRCGSIPFLLMPWLLKSPEHQQTWYCQCRIGNMKGYSFVNLVFCTWTNSKIWYEMWIHLW